MLITDGEEALLGKATSNTNVLSRELKTISEEFEINFLGILRQRELLHVGLSDGSSRETAMGGLRARAE